MTGGENEKVFEFYSRSISIFINQLQIASSTVRYGNDHIEAT
jgi:hypothetical protein